MPASSLLTYSVSFQTDPLTGLLDLDLLNTGQGVHARKLRGDLRREVVGILESREKGMRWQDLMKAIGEQSSMPVDNNEFSDIIKAVRTLSVLTFNSLEDTDLSCDP